MGIFSSIMEKLGFGKTEAPSIIAEAQAAAPQAAPAASPAVPATPVAISAIDVVGKLEQLAASNPQKLNWKTSIVDLMKLLGLDSGLTERKELAKELGCPVEKMADSAQMNMWLHKTVLEKLAANGGNIPKELLG